MPKLALDDWEPSEVRICVGSRKYEDVEGETYEGIVAVHLFVGAKGRDPAKYKFTLTLVSTGWAIVHVKREADAKNIGEYLVKHYLEAMSKLYNAEILEALPRWVPDWLKECDRFGESRDRIRFIRRYPEDD